MTQIISRFFSRETPISGFHSYGKKINYFALPISEFKLSEFKFPLKQSLIILGFWRVLVDLVVINKYLSEVKNKFVLMFENIEINQIISVYLALFQKCQFIF